MKIYIVLTSDRHTDIQVDLFTDKQQALIHAQQIAIENHNPEDEMIENEIVEGWLLCLRYSSEGDYVRVEEKEI